MLSVMCSCCACGEYVYCGVWGCMAVLSKVHIALYSTGLVLGGGHIAAVLGGHSFLSLGEDISVGCICRCDS